MSQPNFGSSILRSLRTNLGPFSADVSDAVLMDRYIDHRDKFAFELLVRRHMATVQRACWAVLHDHHAAEDVSQAVFLILARTAHSVRNRAAVVGWLVQIAHRVSIRSARKIGRRQGANVDPRELADAKIEKDFADETILHQAIAALSEKHRVPILLCYFEGLSHAEAANHLGWPLGRLKARVERAKELLHRAVTRRGLTLPTASISAILTANSLPASKAMNFVEIVDAALAFGMHHALPPSTPSFTIELAQGALRTMFITKLQWIVGSVALSSVMILSGVAALGGTNQTNQDTKQPPIFTGEVTKNRPILAPLMRKELDANTIAEYEKLGAVYGEFVKKSEDDSFSIPVFVRGASGLKQGLPGFHWLDLPKGEFVNLPQVEIPFGIEIQSSKLTDEGVKQLAALNNLTWLNLNSDRVTDAGLKDLAALKNLTSLTLGSQKVTDQGVKELAALENLTSFTLVSEQLTDEGCESLAALKNLTALTLLSQQLTDAGVKNLAALKNLTLLQLSSQKLTDEGVKDLAALKNLTRLTLDAENLTDAGLKELASLKKLTTLQLNSSRLTTKRLKEISMFENLTSLNLTSEFLGDGLKELAALKNLTTLTLDSLSVTGAGLKEIATLKNLTSLSLGSYKLTDDDVKELAPLQNLSSLTLGSQRFSKVSELVPLKNLTSLTLQSYELKDDGLKDLAALKNLTSLSLMDARKLTDAGMKDLAVLKNLNSLTLFSYQLTDAGLKELAALKNLTSLLLGSQKLTDAGLKEFAALKNLTSMIVGSANVTDAGLKELKGSLPKCAIQNLPPKPFINALVH